MAKEDKAKVREDSDRILIGIRDEFRGIAFGIAWITITISSRVTTVLLGMIAIALWYASTKFHPAKANVFDGVGQFDGNWVSIGGRFFGRQFQINI